MPLFFLGQFKLFPTALKDLIRKWIPIMEIALDCVEFECHGQYEGTSNVGVSYV